jgi:hypothetical protein
MLQMMKLAGPTGVSRRIVMNDNIHRFRRGFGNPGHNLGDLFYQLRLLFVCPAFRPFYDDCRHFSRSRYRLNKRFFKRLALEKPTLKQKGKNNDFPSRRERSENKICEADASMKFKTNRAIRLLFGFRPLSLSPGFECPSRPEPMDDKGCGQKEETDSVRENPRFD